MNNSLAVYTNFPQIREIAQTLANSDLIPPHFQKKPANILIALEFAHRNDIAPFAAMQSLFVVKGKIGMSAAMAISLARKHGVISAINYEVTGSGESLVVKAIAKLPCGSTAESTVSYEMAKKAGWTSNQIYNSLAEQMLKYRAAVFLIRSHFPEVLFGMQTIEEIRDVEAAKNVTPVKQESVIEVIPEVVVQKIEQDVQKNEQEKKTYDLIAIIERIEQKTKENFKDENTLKKIDDKIKAAKTYEDLEKLETTIDSFIAKKPTTE